MQFNFQAQIAALNDSMPFGDNFSFKNSRTRLVPSEYLWNTILPQENQVTYHINGGSMRIYPTMVQMVPMDTPPKPIGSVESNYFNENTTKWGGQMQFPEATLRQMQEFALYARGQGVQDGLNIGDINAAEAKQITQNLFGFSDLLTKAQWDNFEWLRSKALTEGSITLANSGLDLTVDYGIPTANKITRSGSTDSYYGSAPKFWADIRTVFTKLRNFRIIMNSKTYYSIVDNEHNNIRVVDSAGDSRQIIKIVGTTEKDSSDARDRTTINLYDKSGSGITPKGVMKAVPFCPDGKIVIVGEEQAEGFELTQGSTANPDTLFRLGYTHIAPTVEGGRPGIFSRIFTPEALPWSLYGETFSNALPVIQNPNKIMILTTDMPS